MTLQELADSLSPRLLRKISCEDLKELIDVINPAIESRERKALAYGAFAPHRSFEEYRESPEYLSEEISKDE